MHLVIFFILQIGYGGCLFGEAHLGKKKEQLTAVVTTAILFAIPTYILLMLNFSPRQSTVFYLPHLALSGAVSLSGFLVFRGIWSLVTNRVRKWYVVLPFFLLLHFLLLLVLVTAIVGLSHRS